MDDCCQEMANLLFSREFPGETTHWGTQVFSKNLQEMPLRYGRIAKAAADCFVLKTSDSRDFVDAQVMPFTCQKGHKTCLVVVGSRLHLFVWRANMLMLDYWVMDENRVDMVARPDLANWPSEHIVDELAEAVSLYFLEGDLQSADFVKFNQMLIQKSIPQILFYMTIVEMAELFIIFHEFEHASRPIPYVTADIKFKIDPTFSAERQEKWCNEMRADANALNLLWLSLSDFLHCLNSPIDKAKKDAAFTVFSGTDAALHTLSMLERIRYGEESFKNAHTAYEYRDHPPAETRRNSLSQYAKSYCLQTLGAQVFAEIQSQMTPMILARDRLFKGFFTAKPNIAKSFMEVK